MRALAWLAVLAAVVVLMAPTVVQGWGGSLQGAPALLVGPDVVTAPLVDDADLEGSLDVGTGVTAADARAEVAEGRVAGALVLDLRGTEDELLVRDGLHPRVRAALVAEVAALEERYGRSSTVREVPGGVPPDRALLWAVGLSVAAGYLLVVVISSIWGPVPRTWRRGVVRLAGAGALAALATVAALSLPALRSSADLAAPVVTASVVGLASFSAAVTTLALEALLRLQGLAAAALLLLVLPLPLLLAGGTDLLTGVPAAVVPWTVVGASVDAADGVAVGGAGAAVGLSVVLGSMLLALTVLVLARIVLVREREHDAEAAQSTMLPARWRRRIGIGAVVVALTAIGGLLLMPTVDPTPQALPSLAASSECVATGKVDGAEDLNRITQLRGSPEFQGGDVGADALLQDGRRIWVFGDTLRGTSGHQRLVHNSMLVVGEDCLQAVIPESDGALIPDRGDVGYWPMSLTVLRRPGYDLVTVFAQRTRAGDASDPLGFTVLGPAVARFVVATDQTPQLLSVTDLGEDDTDTARPMWGAASVRDGGWLYAYGTARPPDAEPISGFSLRVARMRPDDVTRPGRWRYWDGAAWARPAEQAAELIGSVDGVSQTLSVFRRGTSWYAFSKRNEVLGTDLVFWTSDSPSGPFLAQPPAGELPSDGETGQLRYMPLAHPDLLPGKGTVIVSYSRNSTDVGAVLSDPLLYRPRFLRVALPTP
ncbi:DUF4185 domain-containing protein [Nocardioides sp. BGMRC 2183]|nr:DUF4185 domain-containing protein [Nocardioides sp. BGMRC 2183]